MSAEVSVEPDGDEEGYLIRSPYHPGFVAFLKRNVPTEGRHWRQESKRWWVSKDAWGDVASLLLQYYDEYEFVDSNTGEVTYHTSSGHRIRQEGLGL